MTPHELHTRKDELRAQVRVLKQEREQLAPFAVNGDAQGPACRKRIKQIDRERNGLLGELETIEDALASPQYREATRQELLVQRLDAAFKKHAPRHLYALKVTLADKYTSLQIEDNFHHSQLDQAGLEALPRQIAAELTREAYTREQIASFERGSALTAGDPRIDNSAQLEDLRLKLSVFERHTKQLLDLAKPELPPIPAKLMKLANPPWDNTYEVLQGRHKQFAVFPPDKD